ncbi:DUF4956 domain-containing protein [Clostridium minihomine]|uniref:DUF4956 domain-containing protein n=1 Tax=Clostridium minihomine TaxID=2045012 RepID=UPI001A92A7E2|nr:DUF4956 domain-containing protein [Clostridium minihomine]
MLDSILSTATAATTAASMQDLLICTLASIVLGMGVGLCYMFRNTYSKSFVVTLALMPVIVQTVIMLVNGNLGTGIAVMGAFNLVRFRSIPGSAREIGSIFFAMAIGLATGMGYLTFALIFLALVGVMTMVLYTTKFAEPRKIRKELKIMIPEDRDFEGVFDDLFQKYTQGSELVQVKTTNMGSLYELRYHVVLNAPVIEKEFMDELRCRNGNLSISCGKISTLRDEL